MENTSALLFDNSQQKYFLATGEKAIGPLTTQELYDRMSKGQAHFMSWVWCEGWSDWKTTAEVPEFRGLLPRKPDKMTIRKIEDKIKAKAEEKRKKDREAEAAARKKQAEQAESEAKHWYLFTNGSQYGPFSAQEMHHVIEVQNVDSTAYVWRPGWAQWKAISEVLEFAKLLLPSLPTPPATPAAPVSKASKKEGTKSRKIKPSDRRESARKPLVARLFLANEKEVIVAVCRDISVGGMQVLTDHVPGEVGTVLKLNVSTGAEANVKGFVAEGEIVRVLEDGRGFSFRFTKISEDARRAIQSYIKTQEKG